METAMTVKSSTNRSDGHDSLENEIIPASFNINLATPDPPLIPDSDSAHCQCALTSGKAEKWNRDVFIFLLQTYFQ
jgi:hypothetical protein